jgi:hypothetical protein
MNAWQAALKERREVLLGTVAREKGLLKRIPELLKARGWPYSDIDLVAVISAAVICKIVNAGRTTIRRPSNADRCSGKWPAGDKCTASEIVTALELHDLLE